MSEWETFDSILDSLHEAALSPDGWPVTSGLIDEFLGTHGSTLGCGNGQWDGDFRIYFMWICLRGERRLDLEHYYLETLYPLDEALSRLRRLPYGQLTPLTSVYTEEEMKSSEVYNALQTRARAGHAINVRMKGPDGARILWQVNDRVDGQAWSSSQLNRIGRLLPHVRQAVSVRQALAGAGALGATLTQMLDATGLGIIQLDARGAVKAANDRALDVLLAGDRLFDRDGLLFARSPQENDCLQHLLGRALPPTGARGAGGSMVLGKADPLPALVLHVHPVCTHETDYRISPVAALVLVFDPATSIDIDPALVASALDLSEMESLVAVKLAHGMTVHEIAAAMDRKESTIRSHVKRTFLKHGLSRQAELIRLVRPLAKVPGP